MKSYNFYIHDDLLEVRIYEYREEMHKDPFANTDKKLNDETQGLFVPAYRNDGSGVGLILLNEVDATHKIIAHECVHAAMEFFRKKHKKRLVKFGWQCDDDEEEFAHIVSDLDDLISKEIYELSTAT